MSTLKTINIQNPASSTINIVTDAAGNVGIATVPTNKFHVLGSSNDTINSANLNVKFQGAGGNGLGFGTISSSPYSSYIQSGYVTSLSTATYNLSLNPNGGNVGIGTTSPIRALTVTGSSSPEFVLQNTSGTTNYKNWRFFYASDTFYMGILNDAGTAGTERFKIDSSGRVTRPFQTAFYAAGSGGNVTTTNMYDFIFDNVITNIGNNYNGSNGRFTAPIAGLYHFSYNLFNNGGTGRISFKYNSGSYNGSEMDCSSTIGPIGQSATIYLNANDWVTVGDWQSISGKTIYMGHSSFSGFLV